MKKTLIHFIYSLGRGGAETMLVRVIKELPEYDHIVVTLLPENHFKQELQCNKLVCLNMTSLTGLPHAIAAFKKLVKKEKPYLVHTHLFWPTFIARFAVPKNIPLVTTIHQFINSSVEYKHWYIRLLDRWSYRFRDSIIIVVAKGAMSEYFSFLKMKPFRAYVLYTFVDVDRFNKKTNLPQKTAGTFRMIAVGALREQKNFSYLVKAMSLLKNEDIELDIYGDGDLRQILQNQITETGARVHLKGQVSNIEEVIPMYDIFVMPSTYEGFSLGVLEAMAMAMPLLLSDNPSFKEQAEGHAWFFSLTNINELTEKILVLSKTDKQLLIERGEAGRQRAINNFTLSQHIVALRTIYSNALQKNS